MRIALRIEVTTLRGLRVGVPNLMRLFNEYQVRASFFFPTGHDYAGRYPLRTFGERSRFGWSALTYGTLLLAPAFAADVRRLLPLAARNGHEVGLVGHSPLRWAARVARADGGWVERQLAAARAELQATGHAGAVGFAANDWQAHPAVLGALRVGEFAYCSLSRGRFPFYPVLQGVRAAVAEIPTTLPTVDELLARPGVTPANVHEFLYAESRHLLPAGHVFSLNAASEGIGRLPLMEKLLTMWKGQDGSVRAVGDVLRDVQPESLPHHQIGWGRVDGCDRHLLMQSLVVPT